MIYAPDPIWGYLPKPSDPWEEAQAPTDLTDLFPALLPASTPVRWFD